MTRSMIAAVLIPVAVGVAQDRIGPFEQIKADMAKAACCRFEFLSIIESQVFESVDTTMGAALIASDGRYQVTVGPDVYLRTADRLYSFSGQENQVTVEILHEDGVAHETVSFVTRLDDFYSTAVLTPGREYFLRRTDSAAVSLPDSLLVIISGENPRLDRLEYYDVNDELNRIVFSEVEYLDRCDESSLTPRFPDSAQVIHLQ